IYPNHDFQSSHSFHSIAIITQPTLTTTILRPPVPPTHPSHRPADPPPPPSHKSSTTPHHSAKYLHASPAFGRSATHIRRRHQPALIPTILIIQSIQPTPHILHLLDPPAQAHHPLDTQRLAFCRWDTRMCHPRREFRKTLNHSNSQRARTASFSTEAPLHSLHLHARRLRSSCRRAYRAYGSMVVGL
ncbi:hypothetical protein P692DRAFT_20337161, partial [Suillus brevipes Sb2]